MALTTHHMSHMEHQYEDPGDQLSGIQLDGDWMLSATSGFDNPAGQDLDINTIRHEFDLGMEGDDLDTVPQRKHAGSLPTPSIQHYDCGSIPSQPLDPRLHVLDIPPTDRTLSSHSDIDLPRNNKTHDCTMAALKIVADFHVLAQSCLTAAKHPASPVHPSCAAGDSPREIGSILSHNRESFQKIKALLDCHCSQKQDVLGVVYLAIYKAIAWYAAILGDDGVSSNDQSTSGPFNGIAKTTSFMGSYCLDSEAQRLISAHLILTQLREHLDPLMKRLRDRHPSLAGKDSSTSTPPLGRVSNFVECYHMNIQEELNSIVSKANRIKHT